MPKKCILCGDNATYAIKGTSNYYCEECAAENFSDVEMLVKVEEIAQRLKHRLEELQSSMPAPDEEEALESEGSNQ